MMRCNLCGEELQEGLVICPACGACLTEAEPVSEDAVEQKEETILPEEQEEETKQPEKKKKNRLVIALAIALGVAWLALLTVVVYFGVNGLLKQLETTAPAQTTTPTGTIPADGNPEDVTCKGSYTAGDDALKANADTVIMTLGDMILTNKDLQICYWMSVYDYVETNSGQIYFNTAMPLDQQVQDSKTGMTWQQYFLKNALDGWKTFAVLCQEAKKAGFEMPKEQQEELDGMRAEMTENYIDTGKFASLDAMIQADMGAGANYEAYETYMFNRYLALAYYTHLYENTEATMEDMEAFFTANEEALKSIGITKEAGDLADVRHILIVPTGGTKDAKGNVTYSEDEWEACRQTAQQILDSWKAGEATEDSFGKLANEKSEDPGSKSNGGLYQYVSQGEMVEEFDAWLFDESRQKGDTGLVKTTYGYHIMYFVHRDATWIRYCELNAPIWMVEKEILAKEETMDLQVCYENISLWNWIIAS